MSGSLDRRIHDIFDAERQQLLDDLAAAEERLDAKESEKTRLERKLQGENGRLKSDLEQLQRRIQQQQEASTRAAVGLSRFRERSDAADEEIVQLRARLEDAEGRYRGERRLRTVTEQSWNEKYQKLEQETARVRRLADERLGLLDVKQREWSQERARLQVALDQVRLEIGREAGLLAESSGRRRTGLGFRSRRRSQRGQSVGSRGKGDLSEGEGSVDAGGAGLAAASGVESEDDELVAGAARRRGGHSSDGGGDSEKEDVGAWRGRAGSPTGAGTGGFSHAVRQRQGRLIGQLRKRCRQLRAELHDSQMQAERAQEEATARLERAQAEAADAMKQQTEILGKQLKAAAGQVSQAEGAVADLRSRLSQSEQRGQALGEQLGKARADAAAAQQHANALRGELERIVQTGAEEIRERVEAASQSAARVVEEHAADLRDARAQLGDTRGRVAALETQLSEAQGSVAGLRARLEAARSDAASARADAAEARTRVELLESGAERAGSGGGGRQALSGGLSRLHQENSRLLQREADLLERCKALEAQAQSSQQQAGAVRDEVVRLRQALQDESQRQEGLKALIRDLHQDRLRLRVQLNKTTQKQTVRATSKEGTDRFGSRATSEPHFQSGLQFGPRSAAEAMRGLVAPQSSLDQLPGGSPGRAGTGALVEANDTDPGFVSYHAQGGRAEGTSAAGFGHEVIESRMRSERHAVRGQHGGKRGVGGGGSSAGGGSGLTSASFRQDVLLSKVFSPAGAERGRPGKGAYGGAHGSGSRVVRG